MRRRGRRLLRRGLAHSAFLLFVLNDRKGRFVAEGEEVGSSLGAVRVWVVPFFSIVHSVEERDGGKGDTG